MIQDFSLIIKSALNSQNIKFFNEPSFEQIEWIESYCLNHIHSSSVHCHNNISCKSSNLVYFRCYSRHYVSFHQSVHDDLITIPVFYCQNDKHFHAVLPGSIFIPHCSFSVFFVLKILALKFFSSFTVGNLTSMFGISVSTLYRWIKKYHTYLRIFNFLKNKYKMSFFVHLIYNYSSVIQDLFDFNLHTLFQYDRSLFNRTS